MLKRFLILSSSCLCLLSCGGKSKETAVQKDTAVVPLKVTEIIGVAEVEPKAHIVSLYAEAGGIVTRILHDINEEVKEGEIIIELSSEVEEAQLAQAVSKVATQEALIRSAQAQAHSMRIKLENAQTDYDRNKKLFQSGAVTQQVLDNSRFALEGLQADVNTTKANLQQQQSKLRELSADIKYYKELVARKKVKALADGKILSMDVKVGNSISTSQSVCDFAPDGPLMAVTEVDELFADLVTVGQETYIRPQGEKDTLGTGKVYLTSPYLRKKSLFSDGAGNMEDRRVREVRILLDPNVRALIGSRVEAVILLNK